MLQELEQETQSQSDDQSELDLNSEFSYPSYCKMICSLNFRKFFKKKLMIFLFCSKSSQG